MHLFRNIFVLVNVIKKNIFLNKDKNDQTTRIIDY